MEPLDLFSEIMENFNFELSFPFIRGYSNCYCDPRLLHVSKIYSAYCFLLRIIYCYYGDFYFDGTQLKSIISNTKELLISEK